MDLILLLRFNVISKYFFTVVQMGPIHKSGKYADSLAIPIDMVE